MRKVPGVVDLDTSIPSPLPENTVYPDLDRAAALGVDPATVTQTLGLLVGGVEASTYQEREDQYAVYLRADARFRHDPSLLGLITVPSPVFGQVPLTDVVRSEDGAGPSQITRTARARSITITCNVAPGYPEGAISAAMERALAAQDLPPGYTYAPFGRSKEMARTGKAFAFAFLMSFIFMYLVLAAQFESWLHPFTIMLALPLTLPFALLSLVMLGQPLNIFSMLGLLVLFGVVKKNAILQIDHANQLRARGVPRDAAILDASRDRLRPILMTTFAFVAGMIPLVLSKGIGAGFSKAMAGIVVGGQTLSLVLTLIAIPVFYSLFDSLAVRAGRVTTWALRLRKKDRGEHDIVDAGAPVPVLPAGAGGPPADAMMP
jgi:multidrug efflux pump subunit AcrB